MAVVNAYQIGWTNETNNKGETEYNLSWLVETDSMATGPDLIRAHIGIEKGDLYEGVDEECYAARFRCERDDKDVLQWHYTITFSSDTNESESVLDEPYEIEFDGEWEEQEVFFDTITGEFIGNSLGYPFIERTMDRVPIEIVRVSKWRAEDDPILALEIANKTNQFDFNGRPPGTTITDMPIRKNAYKNIGGERKQVWHDTMVFKYKAEGWQVQKLDEGYAYLDDADNIVEAKTDDLTNQKTPVFLDGTGHKLDIDLEDPIPLYFNTKDELDYSVFGLDGVF